MPKGHRRQHRPNCGYWKDSDCNCGARQTKRTCAVCGLTWKGAESTYGFKTALKLLGHPNWQHDKCHASCLRQYEKEQSK